MKTEEYRISFFKPTTLQALKNRNLILKLFIIWAVAIFGFQILLRVLEEPVPEQALITFKAAWENIESGTATVNDYQRAGQSMVQVMGKSTIDLEDFAALSDVTGWVLSQVYPESELDDLEQDVRHLNRLREQITSLRDTDYLAAKDVIIGKAAPALDIGENTLLAQLLAIGLDANLKQVSDEHKNRTPEIMELYLVHNRSVLTDYVFLGFPFHYFYTSIFLLVFFVGLCWYYCYRTDKLHAKLNFLEKVD
ncbi:MAG: DUF4212 domain-containing protein [Bacteroidales bacterium]|nr:DUF4212 domain-containing protein [Bacteroidales bacterium]